MMERFREIHEAAYSNYPTSFLTVRFFKHELNDFKTRIQEMLSRTDRKESSTNSALVLNNFNLNGQNHKHFKT